MPISSPDIRCSRGKERQRTITPEGWDGGGLWSPQMGIFSPRIIVQSQDAVTANLPRPTAYHPKEARPVFWHVKFWVHRLQEPPEVFTLELGPKLLPLGHVPKGFLRKQNG